MLSGGAPELSREQLVAALGDDFLAYVCAAQAKDIEEVRRGRRTLEDARQDVFESTVRLATQFASWRRPNASNDDGVPPPGQEYEPLVSSFGRFFALTDAGLTVADSLRTSAGGAVRALPNLEADPVRHALHWLARDIWPYLLLPAGEEYRGAFPLSGASVAMFGHPAQGVLLEAVQRTREPLRLLYPAIRREHADSVLVASSGGTTGRLQISLLGERLISCAAERCDGRLGDHGDELFEALDQEIGEIRSLMKGRSAEVPATVGLTGVRFSADEQLVTALGTLWAAPTVRSDGVPGTADPDVLLAVRVPLKYTRSQSPPEGPPPGFWDSRRTLEERIDCLRLAFLLARGPTAETLRTVSEQIHDPLFAGGHRSRFVVRLPFAARLDAGARTSVTDWAERIAQHYRPEIALAVRRTLSAADLLREPDDALVDAVIALESLFGTGESEVGFRLQTALAFLLGADEKKRRAIHKDVRELYEARSDVVHGTSGQDQELLFGLRQRAVALAVSCMRLLFSTHHGLIPDQARGKRIILAAGQGFEQSEDNNAPRALD